MCIDDEICWTSLVVVAQFVNVTLIGVKFTIQSVSQNTGIIPYRDEFL